MQWIWESQVQDSCRVAEGPDEGFTKEESRGTQSFVFLVAWWMVVPFTETRKAGRSNTFQRDI